MVVDDNAFIEKQPIFLIFSKSAPLVTESK